MGIHVLEAVGIHGSWLTRDWICRSPVVQLVILLSLFAIQKHCRSSLPAPLTACDRWGVEDWLHYLPGSPLRHGSSRTGSVTSLVAYSFVESVQTHPTCCAWWTDEYGTRVREERICKRAIYSCRMGAI